MNLAKALLKTSSVLNTIWRSAHLEWSPNKKISKKIWDRYATLPIPDCKIQVTYVWIDGTGEHVRAKTKTMDYTPCTHKECPNWDFDGSSTGLATTNNSDTLLSPVALYKDPITKGNNKIVLCETYTFENKPSVTNHRHACVEALNQICDKEPMFGLEQEYQLMDINARPFGWPWVNGEPAPAGPYYCGVGANKAYGREIVESHYRACLYAGVDMTGVNAEVNPSQWEFQTGPTVGIKAADDLWMARYLLWRVAEDYGVAISLYPKLLPHWNGAGCHANFSTKEMRDEGGMKVIEEAIGKLEKKHAEHIKVYDPHGGKDNALRLTGVHETSSAEKFTWGVADRGASVRINKRVAEKGKGYLEDRRPSANCDPYAVINAIVRTTCLDCEAEKKKSDPPKK